MSVHPSAWLAWLTSISLFAFVVTNPLYVLLALGAVIVVHLSFPPEASVVGRAVGVFIAFGLGLLVLRLVFVALLPNPGRTTLFTVPALHTPRWLGGLELGGQVTAEVVVAAAGEGLRLVVVLAAFGVFNARADLAALMRMVPAAFRDVGLVVSIAVAFVPGMLRTIRDVRDAQRLRDERGLRTVAPSLVVPVLGLSLERALVLAESMDARGYGRGGASRSSRVMLWAGVACVLLAVAAWLANLPSVAAPTAVAGAASIVWGFRVASLAAPTSKLAGRSVTAFDLAVIGASAAVIAGGLVAGADAFYDAYPVVDWPPFSLPTGALTMLLTVPALAGAADPRTVGA